MLNQSKLWNVALSNNVLSCFDTLFFVYFIYLFFIFFLIYFILFTFNVVLDLENFKCCDYYRFLIKLKYERPKKWAKLREEFDLEDNYITEAFLLPIRISSEPYL